MTELERLQQELAQARELAEAWRKRAADGFAAQKREIDRLRAGYKARGITIAAYEEDIAKLVKENASLRRQRKTVKK
jgi:hypothetical protein